MRRTRRTKRLPSSDVENNDASTRPPPPKQKTITKSDDSSSESDIENYLQPIDKIDFSSSFFNTQQQQQPKEESFEKIEQKIFKGVSKLTDSSSEDDDDDDSGIKAESNQNDDKKVATTSKLNFQQLQEYTKKLEDAKQQIANYNANKQQLHQDNLDIFNMLKSTEMKSPNDQQIVDLHSSDFESCSDDSEKEGWETVKNKEHNEKAEITKEGVQITIELPNTIKKKKNKVDLLAAMKRRLNRIRKENQVFIHKVHLLCWIAHGNYINSIINNERILACALSLLPSDKCYPSERTDLKYLEQIVRWYRNTMHITEKVAPKSETLEQLLEKQIETKQCYNKKMLIYVFVAILRALGIHCRLVLSFRVEPLRPPASELCSLSTKTDTNDKEIKRKSTSKKSSLNQSRIDKPKSLKDKIESSIDKKAKFPPKVQPKENTAASSKIQQNTIKEFGNSRSQRSTTRSSIRSKVEETAVKKSGNSRSQRSKTTSSTAQKSVPSMENKEDKRDGNSNKKQSEIPSTAKKNEQAASPKGSVKNKRPQRNATKHVNVDLKGHGEPQPKRRAKSTADKPTIAEDTKLDAAKTVKTRSKSTSTATQKHKKDLIKIKLPPTDKEKMRNLRPRNNNNNIVIPQVDGAFGTDEEEEEEEDKSQSGGDKQINLKKLREPTKIPKYKDTDSEDEFVSPSSSTTKTTPKKSKYFEATNVAKDVVKLVKNRINEQKHIDQSKMVKKKKRKSTKDEDDDEGSDYVPEPIQKKHHNNSDDEFVPKTKVKRRIPAQTTKVLSSDDEHDGKTKKKQGNDVWIEVFLENEEKWISCDLIAGEVHCVNQLYKRATHPVCYIVAWNNNNTLKDITKRYCQNFNTITRKLRVEANWWEETLQPYVGATTVRDREEDDELERQQLEKPLPTSIAELKNHPLYVLKRHLLKFQGIYPPDAPTLGFVRNEPIYSRQCVYTLHSRDIWLKHAKVVKLGEKPYKIVKARPKYDKLSNTVITDQLLEVFGPWQTEDYVPPTAENGIVPRNAFGNVELFKSCMLPKNTVHLKLPGLNKIARRLDIDCASAITGFDFHSGWSHPVYDGFVVCEEFADQLVAAWELEQEEQEKKQREKVEKRVYTNWRRLIRGLLIRERLKAKYDFGQPSTSGGGGKAKKKAKGATKKKGVCSETEDSGSD